MSHEIPKNNFIGYETPTSNFLIELAGNIDVGKGHVGLALANQLGAHFISLPRTGLDSINSFSNSLSLLKAISSNFKYLETHREWWFHTYITSVLEYTDYIKSILKTKPVIITNYTASMKAWGNALGLSGVNATVNSLNLPKTNKTIVLLGAEWQGQKSQNLELKMSPDLKFQINAWINKISKQPNAKSFWMDQSGLSSHVVNRVSVEISKYLSNLPDCNYSTNFLFPKDYFVNKKDL